MCDALFGEPHVHADGVGLNVGGVKIGLGDEVAHGLDGVGAFEQDGLEGDFGKERVEEIHVHALNFLVNRRVGRIAPQVVDEGLRARAEDAIYFLEGGDGFTKVFEGGGADDKIELVVGKRHSGGVAETEIYGHICFVRFGGGDFDKGLADVESRDLKPSFANAMDR